METRGGRGCRGVDGFLIGTAVKVGLAFAMIAIFIAALFWGADRRRGRAPIRPDLVLQSSATKSDKA